MDEICGLKFNFIIFSALDCVFQPTFSRYFSFKDFHSLSRKVGDNLSFKVFLPPPKRRRAVKFLLQIRRADLHYERNCKILSNNLNVFSFLKYEYDFILYVQKCSFSFVTHCLNSFKDCVF